MGVVPEGAGLVVGNLDLYGINSPRLHLAQDVIPIPLGRHRHAMRVQIGRRGVVWEPSHALLWGLGGRLLTRSISRVSPGFRRNVGGNRALVGGGLDQACFTSRRILHEVARNGGMESGL